MKFGNGLSIDKFRTDRIDNIITHTCIFNDAEILLTGHDLNRLELQTTT